MIAGCWQTSPETAEPEGPGHFPMDQIILSAFHQAASVTRAALYHPKTDDQLPKHMEEDARVPFLGFCGPRFVRGNPVFLMINPGGGTDDYVARHTEDEELIPKIHWFLEAPERERESAFAAMSYVHMQHVQHWNLKTVLQPSREACGKVVEEVCVLNLFPYRTRMNGMPRAHALRNAWISVIAPLLRELRPRFLVALGNKAGGVAAKHPTPGTRLFIVERTIGDRVLCENAKRTIEEIREAVATDERRAA